ncbi:MAG: Eco57I restriction-modification methylase domain-containing protein [Atopobiaceae bacterium]|nr:Eco57I restriction-modification methylase domain-containing protein [Atopobiaceae bacterium]
MADLYAAVYNPDVLSCLANLSNDEVFTPPELANQVLDMLPEEIWKDPNARFLDPCSKTGIFLREIAKRLIRGQMPDFDRCMAVIDHKRANNEELSAVDLAYLDRLQPVLDHIFREQVFGIGITQLTALMTIRSLYCSKWANGKYSVVEFDSSEGNVRYRDLQHTWVGAKGKEKCKWCGASKKELEKSRSSEETHAYELIHTANPERILDMQFDVIVGNPPYQMNDGGNKASASPIYQLFVQQAMKLNPRFLTMIIPARWYSGGKGLDGFRKDMLEDRRIVKLVDYPDSKDCFPGVDIAGGVCYFLWSRDSSENKCEVTTCQGDQKRTVERDLDEYSTFIRESEAVGILSKVTKFGERTMDQQVSSRKPFGLATNVLPMRNGDIRLRYIKGTGPFSRSSVSTGIEMIDKWKVVASYVSFDHAGRADKNGQRKVLSVMRILPPVTVCTETYLVYGAYDSKEQALNLKRYLTLKLPRFLIAQLSSGQHLTKSTFAFCPIPDVSIEWTDEMLAKKYGLTEEESAFIESRIKSIEFTAEVEE